MATNDTVTFNSVEMDQLKDHTTPLVMGSAPSTLGMGFNIPMTILFVPAVLGWAVACRYGAICYAPAWSYAAS